MTETHAPAATAGFYLRRVVHLAAVIDGTPADHALCGMNLQYGAIDTTADATCPECREVAERLAAAPVPADALPENLPSSPYRYDPAAEPAPTAAYSFRFTRSAGGYAVGHLPTLASIDAGLATAEDGRHLGRVVKSGQAWDAIDTTGTALAEQYPTRAHAAQALLDAACPNCRRVVSTVGSLNVRADGRVEHGWDCVAEPVQTVAPSARAEAETVDELLARVTAEHPTVAAKLARAEVRAAHERAATAREVARAEAAPRLTAAAVTRVLRTVPGGDLFASRLEASIGTVRVSQRYAVAGALTPADRSDRREARARAGAEALTAAGYAVDREFDRLSVTLPSPAPTAGCDCSAVPGPHAAHCDDCSAPADRCVCAPADRRDLAVVREYGVSAEVAQAAVDAGRPIPVDAVRQSIRYTPSAEGVAGELALALLNAPDAHLRELDTAYAAHAATLTAGQRQRAAYVRRLIEHRAWLRETARRAERELSDRIPADRVRYAGDLGYLASLDRQEANLRGQAEQARAALAAMHAAGPEYLPYGPAIDDPREQPEPVEWQEDAAPAFGSPAWALSLLPENRRG